MAEPVKKATIQLLLDLKDKILLKTYAAKNNTTMSKLVSKWINENCGKDDRNE